MTTLQSFFDLVLLLTLLWLAWRVLAAPDLFKGIVLFIAFGLLMALAQLPNSGVTNPVTAAVLNYRGYDTLLEIAVPLMILLAATCFGLAPLRPAERSKAARSWPPRLFYCDLAESPGRAG